MRQSIVVPAIIGLVGIIVAIVLAIVFPWPTPHQVLVFRTALSLFAGGAVAAIPGLLNVRITIPGITIRATFGLAAFVIVYLINPGRLIEGEKDEMRLPIITFPTDGSTVHVSRIDGIEDDSDTEILYGFAIDGHWNRATPGLFFYVYGVPEEGGNWYCQGLIQDEKGNDPWHLRGVIKADRFPCVGFLRVIASRVGDLEELNVNKPSLEELPRFVSKSSSIKWTALLKE